MKPIFTLSIVLLLVLNISCDPCAKLDCLSDELTIDVRIVRQDTRQDLLFGPGAIFNPREMEFFSVSNGDTTYYEPGVSYVYTTRPDSVLSVYFNNEPAIAYMRFPDNDVDTLVMTYDSYKSRCCGQITSITKYSYNGRLELQGSVGVQEILK